MTDEELKQLVANLAISQEKTDEQLRKTDEQLKYLAARIAISQEKTDEQLRKTDEQLKELAASAAINQGKTDEQLRKNDEQIAELRAYHKDTERKLNKASEMLGNIGKNQGDVAEEFFFNSLKEDPRLGNISFEDVAQNEHKYRSKTEEEYDIVMTNGNAIGIVEVKYKAHENDLDKLERKMRHFKTLFPVYKDYKLYGAIASFHIYDAAKKAALRRGFFVLQRSGNLIRTDCADHLLVM